MEKFKLVTVNNLNSPVSEAYKMLRTNIQFSNFDENVKAILITSAGPGEGKSTTAANLAVVMAQSGKKTILVDCDQRKPRLHKIFRVSNIIGLSNFLVNEVDYESAILDTGIENLHILTSGTKPPNPTELLGSNKMKLFINVLKDRYDYIIMDTAPILIAADTQVLSKSADGCILVVCSNQAEREAVIKGKELLNKVNSRILGVVLNKTKENLKSYYGYYSNEHEEHKHKRKHKKVYATDCFK